METALQLNSKHCTCTDPDAFNCESCADGCETCGDVEGYDGENCLECGLRTADKYERDFD